MLRVPVRAWERYIEEVETRDRMRVFKNGRIWHGWFYTPDGKRVQRSTRMRSKAAAEAVVAEWERAAADPNYAAASTATLSQALKLLADDREQQAKAGRRADSTVAFYREKAGVLNRLLETDEHGEYAPLLLAQLRPWHVDRFISQRRSEWAIAPRDAIVAEDGTILMPARTGRRVTDHTISKEVVALRAALKLARRAGLFDGDPGRCPHGFAPEYEPRKRFLTREELCRLLASQTRDHAAQIAFMVATSAEWGAVTRARREDVASDLAFVRVRGTKRKTRDRSVPIVTDDQRSLLKYALEHAQGENGLLFLDWQNVRRDLRAACVKLEIPRCSPNDLRRTCATWLRAAGTPPHLIAPLMGHADSRMVERVYGRLEAAALAQLIAKATGSTSAGSQQTGTDRLAFGGQDGQRAARKSAKLAPRAGFEPATHGLTVRCSAS